MTKEKLFTLGGWWIIDNMIRLPDGRIFDMDYDISRCKYKNTFSLRCMANQEETYGRTYDRRTNQDCGQPAKHE